MLSETDVDKAVAYASRCVEKWLTAKRHCLGGGGRGAKCPGPSANRVGAFLLTWHIVRMRGLQYALAPIWRVARVSFARFIPAMPRPHPNFPIVAALWYYIEVPWSVFV